MLRIDNSSGRNDSMYLAEGLRKLHVCGSQEGAQRAAMMYLFNGTCNVNDVEPFARLKDVLTRILDHSIQKLE